MAEEVLTEERGEADTDRKRNSRNKAIAELADYFQFGDGNFGKSKSDAVNAFTQWLTPRQEQYADSAKFARKFAAYETGSAARTRERVLNKLAA